jgi:beta-phosphoglucomutase-like phosphatase (HAD superfamily)
MTEPIPPFAVLDNLLRQVRHLLIDFDGPICSLYPHSPTLPADRLRALLAAQGIQLPDLIAETADPLAVVVHAANIGPELARQAEAELTSVELSAVPTAQPTGYAHDVISSARESGRTVTIISTCAAAAVNAYLAQTSLTNLVDLVVARTGRIPAPEYLALIQQAFSELDADPSSCAIVADSLLALQSAIAAGSAAIAYVRSDASEPVTTSTGTATASLVDLTLRLRARPLPN